MNYPPANNQPLYPEPFGVEFKGRNYPSLGVADIEFKQKPMIYGNAPPLPPVLPQPQVIQANPNIHRNSQPKKKGCLEYDKRDKRQFKFCFLIFLLVLGEVLFLYFRYHFISRYEREVEDTFKGFAQAAPLKNISIGGDIWFRINFPDFNGCNHTRPEDSSPEDGKSTSHPCKREGLLVAPFNLTYDFYPYDNLMQSYAFTSNCPPTMRKCAVNLCVVKQEPCPMETIQVVPSQEASLHEEFVQGDGNFGFAIKRTCPKSTQWISNFNLIIGTPCLSSSRHDYDVIKGLNLIHNSKAATCIDFNGDNYEQILTWSASQLWVDNRNSSSLLPEIQAKMDQVPVSFYAIKNTPFLEGAYQNEINEHFFYLIEQNYDAFVSTIDDLTWYLFPKLFCILSALLFLKFRPILMVLALLNLLFNFLDLIFESLTNGNTKTYLQVFERIFYFTQSKVWQSWSGREIPKFTYNDAWIALILAQSALSFIWLLQLCFLYSKSTNWKVQQRNPV